MQTYPGRKVIFRCLLHASTEQYGGCRDVKAWGRNGEIQGIFFPEAFLKTFPMEIWGRLGEKTSYVICSSEWDAFKYKVGML